MTDELTKTVLGVYYPLHGRHNSELSSLSDYTRLVSGTLLRLRGIDRFSRGPKTTLYFKSEPGVSLEYEVSMGYGRTVEVMLVETHRGKPKKLEEAISSLVKSRAGLPEAVSEFDDYGFVHNLIGRLGGELSHAIRTIEKKQIVSISRKPT